MTQEQPFITTRNLIDTDVGPLRRFTGILDSMPTEEHTYGEGINARKTTRVLLNYKDLEVIEAVEPYHFPIYTAQLSLSNRKKSRWGILGQSLNDILDQQYTPEQLDPTNPSYIKPSDRMDINSCIGKRLGMVMSDGENGRPFPPMLFDGRAEGGAGGDVPTLTWRVYMVEGIGVAGEKGISPMDKAMQLLDGKTLAQFNQLALADSLIRGDVQLLQSLGMPASAPNAFGSVMLSSGKFTKDEQEVFHMVVVPETPAPAAPVTPPVA